MRQSKLPIFSEITVTVNDMVDFLFIKCITIDTIFKKKIIIVIALNRIFMLCFGRMSVQEIYHGLDAVQMTLVGVIHHT